MALLAKYAVRFDRVDRITFYSRIIRQMAPSEQGCEPTISTGLIHQILRVEFASTRE